MARSRRIGFINIISGLAATVALTLPLAAPGAYAAEPKSGGSVSITLESDLPSLDPLSFASYNDRNAGLLMYDTLLDIDEKGDIIPGIAEKIDSAKDAMSFKLTLRNGVKFTDGTPYDAAAVVKNFERIRDPKNRCRCISDLGTIDTVEATGLTKREWLMAHFPLDPIELRPQNGPGFSDDEDRLRIHARLARLWADAIIKEAARE